MQVAELDDSGHVQACHPMEAELPFISWLGGVCLLLPESVVPRNGESFHEICARIPQDANQVPLCLWRLCGIPVDFSESLPVERWERLR